MDCPTHPFIDFALDLRQLSHEDWILLGEACSKIAHVIGVPLSPAVARELHTIALVRGARATTAIEGNTLSEEQVRDIVEGRLRLPPSQAYLQQEVENVVRACNEVLADFRDGRKAPLDGSWLQRHNAAILDSLQLAADVVPGEWRRHVVGVGGYRAPPPEYVRGLMDRLFVWLGELGDDGGTMSGTLRQPMQLVRALVAHLYIAWIHPFGDGNGRSARLLEFALLLSAGVPSASAHVLSNHYNETRSAYYRELDVASKLGTPYSFIRYSLVGLVDGLRNQIRLIQNQQERVIWTNYVYEVLDPRTVAEKRRARLALELAFHPTGVRRRELATLTTRLARDYSTTTAKTLTRDLNALRESGLLVHEGGVWRANVDLVRAFRPFTTDATPWVAPS